MMAITPSAVTTCNNCGDVVRCAHDFYWTCSCGAHKSDNGKFAQNPPQQPAGPGPAVPMAPAPPPAISSRGVCGVSDSHYSKMPIQPFDYSMANGFDPFQHTIIKYVSRWRDKNGIRDLRAAIDTIEMYIAYEEAKAK